MSTEPQRTCASCGNELSGAMEFCPVCMYQHQHAPLPVDQLARVPEPVVVLLDGLLERDPAQRFQTPAGLLKASESQPWLNHWLRRMAAEQYRSA
jgi:hypothetical protein